MLRARTPAGHECKMNLVTWRQKNPDTTLQKNADGSVFVFSAQGDWDLFHLTDYIVRSATSGPKYELWPVPDDIPASQKRVGDLTTDELAAELTEEVGV